MTALLEAELIEGQGMSLSGHKMPKPYRGDAKKALFNRLEAL